MTLKQRPRLGTAQRLAMAIWNMREWGVHPTWIEYFVETGQAVYVAEQHVQTLEAHPEKKIVDMYTKPKVGNGPF